LIWGNIALFQFPEKTWKFHLFQPILPGGSPAEQVFFVFYAASQVVFAYKYAIFILDYGRLFFTGKIRISLYK